MKITSGKLKGRLVGGADTIRSTKSIVRESIFNIIASSDEFPQIKDSTVVDVFCGSGILSFEAISRGAKFAVMNDIDKLHRSIALSNARELGVFDNVKMLSQNASVLDYDFSDVDIAMIDPPFGENLGIGVVDNILKKKNKEKKILIVIELCKLEMFKFNDVYGDDKVRKYGRSYVKFMYV